MGAAADFARLPTRQKVFVIFLIGAVLGLGYRQFVYSKLKDNLQAAEGEHDSKTTLNQQLERDIPEFEKLNARYASLKRLIDENQKALPTEAELPAFFETLNRKALESGIEIIRSTQGSEQPIERFIKVPINYEIQGTFVQIKKFFASLLPKKKKPGPVDAATGGPQIEERERIVSIENLSLTNPVVRNREISLTAKFTASTFRQEDKKADTKAPPTRAAPASTPSPPNAPPPPASTPKGAKAQTEKSLEKGDQRNRDAAGVKEAKTPGGSGVERMKGGL